MIVDETARSDTPIYKVPLGGVFRTSNGQVFMRMPFLSNLGKLDEIPTIHLSTGGISLLPKNTLVEYFAKASIKLEQ